MAKYLKLLILLLPNLLNGQNTLTGEWLGKSNSIKLLIFNTEDSLTLKSYGQDGAILSMNEYTLLDNEIKNYLNSSNDKNDTLFIIESDLKHLKIKLSPVPDTLNLYKSNGRDTSNLVEEMFIDGILELSILENELVVEREILYKEEDICYRLRPEYSCFDKVYYKLKSSKDRKINILELKTRGHIYSSILIIERSEKLIKGIALEKNKVIELKLKEWETEESYNSLMIGEWVYVFDKAGLTLDSSSYKDYPKIKIDEDLNYEMTWRGGENYARIKYEKIGNDVLSMVFKVGSPLKNQEYRLIVKEIKDTHVILSQVKCITSSEDWEEDTYWKKIR